MNEEEIDYNSFKYLRDNVVFMEDVRMTYINGNGLDKELDPKIYLPVKFRNDPRDIEEIEASMSEEEQEEWRQYLKDLIEFTEDEIRELEQGDADDF